MTSVYFPSHVFILFRRLVNVVSMLSISRHCISYDAQTYPDHADGFSPQAHNGGVTIDSSRDSTRRLKASVMLESVERSQTWNSPWLMIRQTWDKGLLGTFCNLREVKNTLELGGGALIFWCKIQPFIFLCSHIKTKPSELGS